ncbi:ASCH domain-containing protein [Leisingera sp.]|uniref:ASCH domain-containing protein n=1 Tax=Leisingera sp. TaxID=1879318 RepID=UPI002B26BE55|nr:ASCH domain-containing protein [Leisingera sp.]
MRTLYLPMKGIYFDQIKSGEKVSEFREVKPIWEKRLEGREYDQIVLTRGYPKKGDPERTLVRPWRGCKRTWINHPHFGPQDVEVYAIRVN